jgi:hypothetical protein
MEIKLNPVPKDYEVLYNEIMKDERFSDKMDRTKRLDEKFSYVTSYLPEVINGGYKVLDIGTGPGEFLEVLRNFHCEGIGTNPPENHRWYNNLEPELAKIQEERVQKYINFSKINIHRQKLEVKTIEMYDCFINGNRELEKMKFNIINCQDAINLILIKCYDLNFSIDHYKNEHVFGKWIIDDHFYHCVESMMGFMDKILLPDGAIVMVALTSSNDNKYSKALINMGKKLGYKIEICKNNNVHKFIKN